GPVQQAARRRRRFRLRRDPAAAGGDAPGENGPARSAPRRTGQDEGISQPDGADLPGEKSDRPPARAGRFPAGPEMEDGPATAASRREGRTETQGRRENPGRAVRFVGGNLTTAGGPMEREQPLVRHFSGWYATVNPIPRIPPEGPCHADDCTS